MNLNKTLIPLVMVTPLLLTSCGNGGRVEYDIESAKTQMRTMLDYLMETQPIKEYGIIFDQTKDYFDSVKHTYHTQTLNVDFNEYRIYMLDDKDDHNGKNHYVGKGEFWFWLDPNSNYDYHIAMFAHDCNKKTHSVTKGGLNKNKELISIKAKLETPSGVYGNPRNYSLNLYQTFTETFGAMLKDPNLLSRAKFTIFSEKPGDLTIINENIFDPVTEKGQEYKETYIFKNYLLMEEIYHKRTTDYVNDYSISYEIKDYDIKLPNPNLFK